MTDREPDPHAASDGPVSMSDARRRGRARTHAIRTAMEAPIERQPLLPDQAERDAGRRSPSRLVLVLLASLFAHGAIVSLRIIRGVDPERISEVTSRGPMRVRALQRAAKKKEREKERQAEKEREREQQEERKEKKTTRRPQPKKEVEIDVDDSSDQREEPEGVEGGEGGVAGPLFGGTPTAGGSGGTGGGGGYTLGSGDGSGRPIRKKNTDAKVGVTQERKKKKGRGRNINPDEPVRMTREMKPPKPHPGNRMPSYPEPVRKRGISGTIAIKIHVHKDGTVRGIKIVRAENDATKESDQRRANEAFKKAVVRAVQHWKYEPAEYKGKRISVWVQAKFPFKLKG